MSKANIIVIHQSVNVGEDADHILSQAGYKVTLISDPHIAEKMINESEPDIVLIEDELGELSTEIISTKITNSYFNLPVISIVSQASQISDLKAMHTGIFDYLPKPLSPELLLKVIDQAIDHRNRTNSYVSEVVQRNLQAMVKREDIFNTLHHTIRSVASSLDLDKVLITTVDAAVDLTNADEGNLYQLVESSGDLYLRATRDLQNIGARASHVFIQDSLANQILRTGKPVKIEEKVTPNINDEYLVYPSIYVPIQIHDRILGVLSVNNRRRKHLFTDDHLLIITSLADIAASAIENARRFSQKEAERSQLEAILTNLNDGVIVLDLDERLLFLNEAARKIFGLDDTDLMGKSYKDIFHHPDMLEMFDGSEFPRGRTEISMEDGQIYNANFASIPDIGYALTMQDITHLKELDRIKSDFVNTVSHDLRSPLTAILGYVELIARAGPINAQQREFIKRIEYSVNNITALINDLLDLGRIEAGFDIRKEFIHIPPIIQYAIEGLCGQIDGKEQVVLTKFGENLPPVFGNPIRLRQMFNNLLINAINYTPVTGCIEISAHEESGQIIILVSDNGPGIPLADQPYIFDKFFRGSNIPYDSPGTGLGLAIVKSIVDNHQGRIWVESMPETGTTFTIVLPVSDINL